MYVLHFSFPRLQILYCLYHFPPQHPLETLGLKAHLRLLLSAFFGLRLQKLHLQTILQKHSLARFKDLLLAAI